MRMNKYARTILFLFSYPWFLYDSTALLKIKDIAITVLQVKVLDNFWASEPYELWGKIEF